tara:strand:+ start:2714 stop:4306 length:1593 start_codon:yes stop_codon:yes gene_type:complete
MKINKITIQNFYSFIDSTVDFGNYSGLTVIKGKNNDTGGSNGSGKSALVEAVYFGLTGKTIRKSTEDSLVNNQAKKKCVVQVQLVHNNEYVVITRQKKPTKLEFVVGSENRTKESVATTQAEIESFLNINHKVLLASMFFGQANDVNFLDSTADEKRSIIRNFLDLDDLFLMRDRIKKHKSTFYQGAKEKQAIVVENGKNIERLDSKITEVEQGKKQFSSYDESILSLTLDEILDSEKASGEIDLSISKCKKKIRLMRDEACHLREKIKDPNTDQHCLTCGSKLKTEFLDVDATKDVLDSTLEAIRKEEDTIDALKASKKPTPISSREFSQVLKYKDLCRDGTNYSAMKEDISDSTVEAEESRDENKTLYEIMRFWEKAFSEQGVIKYVIRNILGYFNDRCNFYLSYLTNSKYSVEFNEELIEKIETDKRMVPYISLSGGEKRKFNLAVMLGLKDLLLLTDKSHVDFLFFDEVAENIDEEGIDGLHQLLQEIKKTKTIFIITHNKHLKTLLDSSPRLSIIKTRGISTIKE